MTVAELDAAPSLPNGQSACVQALWHAHELVQDLEIPLASWVHALLHLIEGDVGNAGYWFARAGKPRRSSAQIDALWREIAAEALQA
jgi:hypothetical protein